MKIINLSTGQQIRLRKNPHYHWDIIASSQDLEPSFEYKDMPYDSTLENIFQQCEPQASIKTSWFPRSAKRFIKPLILSIGVVIGITVIFSVIDTIYQTTGQ